MQRPESRKDAIGHVLKTIRRPNVTGTEWARGELSPGRLEKWAKEMDWQSEARAFTPTSMYPN